ncbi:hypothetical protein L1887_24338 [Cichorium endivia]|nr:hypothetical protein L1887_24338 [Cichorium endivia]
MVGEYFPVSTPGKIARMVLPVLSHDIFGQRKRNRMPEGFNVLSLEVWLPKVNDAIDGSNCPKKSVEKVADPEIRSFACVLDDEPGIVNMSHNKSCNGLCHDYPSPNEINQPIINTIEPINDATQPVICQSSADIKNCDSISEDSITGPNTISLQNHLVTDFVSSQFNIVEQNRATPTKKESCESKENGELKENVANSNLQGVSDRLKMLIDKNTPIKNKLEGGEVMQKADNKSLIKKKKKSVDVNSGNYFNRITRSQSRRKNEENDVGGNKGEASSSEISENSFISLGILQQMEEMGNFCGFSMRSEKGKG